MRLYLHSSQGYVTEVHDITLKDGYAPTVGIQTRTIRDDPSTITSVGCAIGGCTKKDAVETSHWYVNPLQLEPAIWFKTLVLDVIVIDCVTRSVRWNSNSDNNDNNGSIESSSSRNSSEVQQQLKRLSTVIFSGGEFYDYEADLDQLLESTQGLMTDYARGNLPTTKFNELILKLLHCHVLPLIAMCKDDLHKLNEVLVKQQEHIQNLDSAILKENNKFDLVQRAINNQCEQYVQELQQGSSCAKWPAEFTKRLLSDLERNSKEASELVESLQQEVNKAKDLPGSQTALLSEKRMVRDNAMATYEQLIKARENLKLVWRKGGHSRMTRRKEEQTQLQKVYIALDGERNLIFSEIQKLTDRKVLMLSVKEAIRSTIEDIQKYSVSMGLDSDGTGKKATDVLRHSVIPLDWKPITEQVFSIVTSDTHMMGIKHREMIKKVRDQCQQALYDKTLMEMSVEDDKQERSKDDDSPLCSRHTTRQSSNRQGVYINILQPDTDPNVISSLGKIDSNEFVFIHETTTNYCRKRILTLKNEIHKHFVEVCEYIQSMVQYRTGLAHKKLWLIYEPHFYQTTMKDLQLLYRKAYEKEIKKLSAAVSQLTVEELQIQSSLILGLLQDKNVAQRTSTDTESSGEGAGSVCSGDNLSLGALNIFEESHRGDSRPSSTLQNIMKDEVAKIVKIHYPISITYINRCTWPPPAGILSMVDVGLEASTADTTSHQSFPGNFTGFEPRLELKSSDKTTRLKEQFQNEFAHAFESIKATSQQFTPVTKLQCLTNCLKQVSNVLSVIQERNSGDHALAGCDDLIDILVILLCNCDKDTLAQLYIDQNLLQDLSAQFLESGPHFYSLIQFTVAFKYIQDRLVVLHRNRKNGPTEDQT